TARERGEAQQLLELLVQQREDALRGARGVGAAVLVEDVHLARGAGLRDLHAVLLGLHLGVAREHAREQAAAVLLGLGIRIAHEVHALLPVAVLHGEADAVEREADAPPDTVEGLEDRQRLGPGDALADLGALLLRRGARRQRARFFLLRTEPDHHAAQELRLELGIGLARLPARIARRTALRVAHRGVDLDHAAMADIDLGRLAVGRAVQACAV